MADVAVNAWFWDQSDTGSGQYLRQLLPALASLASDELIRLIVPDGVVTPPPAGALMPGNSNSGRGKLGSRLKGISPALYKLYFEQRVFPHVSSNLSASVAHVPYHAAPVWSATPTVVTIHDLIPMIVEGYQKSPLMQAYVKLVAAGARRAQAIITDSEASKRDIVARLGIAPGRLHVIPLAPAPHFRPADAGRVRADYAIPQRYILYLGGFDRRKNLSQLIRSFARLVQHDLVESDVHLVVAGRLPSCNSDFAPDPRPMVAELGLGARVVFPGWVADADKPALYSGALAFVFPSLYEGFGLPVVEAMACGAPVITSNTSSLPEVVGEAGVMVHPLDVHSLAAAMAQVVNDDRLRRRMATASQERASHFSWARTAEATLHVYADVREQPARNTTL
jgi:glycosyltransferase involved in cell wall biosynthesis